MSLSLCLHTYIYISATYNSSFQGHGVNTEEMGDATVDQRPALPSRCIHCQHQGTWQGGYWPRGRLLPDAAYLDNASVGQLHFPSVAACFPVTYLALTGRLCSKNSKSVTLLNPCKILCERDCISIPFSNGRLRHKALKQLVKNYTTSRCKPTSRIWTIQLGYRAHTLAHNTLSFFTCVVIIY